MAGGSPKAEEGKKKARIEIIPLIDVIFFLLATFVLFTLSLDKIAAIDVNLPKAVPDQSNTPPDETMLSIQVSDGDNLYWRIGKNPVELITPREVPSRLENYKATTNPPRVLISGDNRAKFGAAVAVLDEVRKVGIEQVSVSTTTTTTGK